MRCSGTSFGVDGGERMPPHTRRREQRPLKWLHGVSRLIQQGECQHQHQHQHQAGAGVQGRRWQQRRLLAQQLFDKISKDGSTLSALDHDSGEVSAGEGQDLWWLGLLPIFETGSGHQLPMSLANHHE